MKVLLVNGSPNEKRCTYTALSEVAGALEAQGVDAEIAWIGRDPVRGCLGCGGCSKRGDNRCIFDDDVANGLIEKAVEADGLVVGTPVFYAGANGALMAVLDRLFYAASARLRFKPAAAVASARRAGTTPAIDQITSIFRSTACRWYRPTTGPWCTAEASKTYGRMPRVCRSCVCLARTWLGCCRRRPLRLRRTSSRRS